MIYKELNRTGMIGDVKTHGGGEIAEVYGGIGESDPIYYKQREMVGTAPMTFKALGLPLKDYLISGNTIQDGAPTPDYPVDVVGCGVKTENLFDENANIVWHSLAILDDNGNEITSWESGYTNPFIEVEPNTTYALNGDLSQYNVAGASNGYRVYYYMDSTFISRSSVMNNDNKTFTTPQNCNKIAIQCQILNDYPHLDTVMLNTGSTALPYEPYGYKLPLTVNDTEYPIYLGEAETTRKIKKVVLTGEESYYKNSESTGNYLYYAQRVNIIPGAMLKPPVLCNELPVATDAPIRQISINTNNDFSVVYLNFGADIMTTQPSGNTAAGLKEYLAAQYANGTPVTVWYVLAEPETAVVNEPLHKIGDYADTISMVQAGVTIPTATGTNTLTVDTTVKPSEIDLTGRLKTSGYGQLLDMNLTAINDSTGTPIFIRG